MFVRANLFVPREIVALYETWLALAVPDRELVPFAEALTGLIDDPRGPLLPIFQDSGGTLFVVRCGHSKQQPRDVGVVYARTGNVLEREGADVLTVLEAWTEEWAESEAARQPLEERDLQAFVSEKAIAIDDRPFGERAAAALAQLPLVIKSLHLGDCGLTAAAARQLAQAPRWSQLEELSVPFNPLGDDGVAALASAPWARHVRRLTVRACELSPAGLSTIFSAAWADRLEQVDGSNNSNREDGGCIDLGRRCSSLRQLDLNQCRLGPSVARAVVDADLPSLERLDLSGQALGDEGAAVLARLTHKPIKVLRLAFNEIRDEGALALVALAASELTQLDLEGNFIHERGALALIESGSWPKLSKLELRNNLIGERAEALLRSESYVGRRPPAPESKLPTGRAWLDQLVEAGEIIVAEVGIDQSAAIEELGVCVDEIFERFASAERRAEEIARLLLQHETVEEFFLDDADLKARLRG